VGRCSFPALQWSMPHFSRCWKPSCFQAHWGRWCHSCLLQPCELCIYSLMRACLSPHLQWRFPHYSHCYRPSPLYGCWAGATTHRECPFPTLLWSCCYKLSPLQGCCLGATTSDFSCWLVYLQFVWEVPLPHCPELRAPCPLCYVSFFFQLLVYYSTWFFLFFFPGWGSVCPGGYADLSQGCLWEYHVLLSSVALLFQAG
jgi:hypothetical protein